MTPSPRERIAAAMVRLVATRGFRAVELDDVLAAAGVSEGEFRRHFDDLEDCFVRLWDEMTLEHAVRADAAYETAGPWRERLRRAAWESLRYLQEDELRTRFLVLEVLSAGEMAQAHRDLAIAAEVRWVDEGRRELPDPDSVPRSVAEHVVGAINEMLVRKTRSGEVRHGDRVLRELMYLAVRPYLGQAAALEEMRMPPPEAE